MIESRKNSLLYISNYFFPLFCSFERRVRKKCGQLRSSQPAEAAQVYERSQLHEQTLVRAHKQVRQSRQARGSVARARQLLPGQRGELAAALDVRQRVRIGGVQAAAAAAAPGDRPLREPDKAAQRERGEQQRERVRVRADLGQRFESEAAVVYRHAARRRLQRQRQGLGRSAAVLR